MNDTIHPIVEFDCDMIGKESIYFSVPGEPFAKQRPRAARKGRYITIYTPRPTKEYEKKVIQNYRKRYKDQEKLDGNLYVKIHAVFSIPKSTTKKERKILETGVPHTKKPDVDNIGKVCLDGMNGVVYEDDGSVYKLLIEKSYGSEARVDITVIKD